MNFAGLIGRTTADIELRFSSNGKAFAKFTLAVDRRGQDDADFIRCTAFGKAAETLSQYVKKGNRLGVTGHIQTGSYEMDGKRINTFDVIVDSFDFLSYKSVQESGQAVGSDFGQAESAESFDALFDDEDLPL